MCLYEENMILTKKENQYFVGFMKVSEKNLERPPHCSLSNTCFANPYKTNKILTILCGRRGGRWRLNFTSPINRQNPFSASTVWGMIYERFWPQELDFEIPRT